MADQFSGVVFELAARGASPSSYHALSWLLKLISQRDPVLAASLHAPNERRPLSLWVGDYGQLGGAFEPVHPDATALMRITSTSARVSGALHDIARQLPAEAALGSRFFPIVHTATHASEHPLGGSSRLSDLVQAATTAGRDRRVTLHFLTPTSFGGRPKTLFPLPALVFKSLIGSWNANVAAAIPDDVAGLLLDGLQVEAHHLSTRMAPGPSGNAEKGFVGWCEYSLGRDVPSEAVRALHMLAAFAFYVGVGGRTTMGMGQVICESPEPRPERRAAGGAVTYV